MNHLCDDLLAEWEDLDRLLAPLDEARWALATPAPGWAIRDQIGHLAYFDDVARHAALDPEGFRIERDRSLADAGSLVDRATESYRHLSGAALRTWLRQARAALVEVARPLDPGHRVPWYGPDMSMASSVTARLMETWAHGQDVADALDVTRVPTERLRHIAFIGVRALPNSYRAQGRPVPDASLRAELTGPGGERWVIGPADATDVVRGPALDFCLLVTQRRHPADTALVADGAVAAEWMTIAQAFAGPPGAGRAAGERPTSR